MPKQADKQIIVVGLQRSGTTWLECLMDNNFWTRVRVRGVHKHLMPHEWTNSPAALGPDGILVIQKRLDHWLSSQYLFPVIGKIRPELFDGGEFDENKATRLYHLFYDEWTNASFPTYQLMYEDLLRDTWGELEKIGSALDLRRLHKDWVMVGTPYGWSGRREYYLDQAEATAG